MFKISFSLRTLLLIILLLALSMAALQFPSAWVDSTAHTVNLAFLGWTIVGSILQRGPRRAFWIAAAVFGWIYLFAANSPVSQNTANWQSTVYRPVYLSTSALGSYTPVNYAQGYYPEPRHRLLTDKFLDLVASWQKSLTVGARVMAQWTNGGYWPSRIVAIQDGAYQIAWDDGSGTQLVTRAQIQGVLGGSELLYPIGHSVFGILIALSAGAICQAVFVARERSNASGTGHSIAC